MNRHLIIDKKFINYSLVMIIAVFVGLLMPKALDYIVIMGRNIPQNNLETDYVIGLIWALILGSSILAWPISPKDKRNMLWIWLIKIFVVLGFMLVYESHYSELDSYSYFEFPRETGFLLRGINMFDGTNNIMSLVWLHQHLIPNSFHATKITFSMIGLIAIYIFYRGGTLAFQMEDRRYLYFLSLFPSILFWSSILGKEPIILLGIAIYFYGVIAWFKFKKNRYIWILLSGVLIAMLIRVWIAPILLASLVVIPLRGIKRMIPRMFFLFATVLALYFSMNQLKGKFALETTQDIFSTVDTYSHRWAHGGSAQEVNFDFTKPDQVFGFVPLGIFTALFRPLPGEVKNMFGVFAGIENLFLLTVSLIAIFRVRWKDLKEPIILWPLFLVLIWASVYGFVSYQNLGTASRFKLQVLPILLFLLWFIIIGTNYRHIIKNNRPIKNVNEYQ